MIHEATPPVPPKKDPTPEPDTAMELSEDEDADVCFYHSLNEKILFLSA